MNREFKSSYLNQITQEGETVIWSGHPCPKRLFTGVDFLYIPFTIVFSTAFLIGAIGMVLHENWLIKVFSLFFFFFGFQAAFGRFIQRYFKFKRSLYVLTDQKIHIIINYVYRLEGSHDLAQLSNVQVKRFEGSGGTVGINLDSLPRYISMEKAAELTMADWPAFHLLLYPSALHNLLDCGEFLNHLRNALAAQNLALIREENPGRIESYVVRRTS